MAHFPASLRLPATRINITNQIFDDQTASHDPISLLPGANFSGPFFINDWFTNTLEDTFIFDLKYVSRRQKWGLLAEMLQKQWQPTSDTDFRFFLCAAIARHKSYREACPTRLMAANHRRLRYMFEENFEWALHLDLCGAHLGIEKQNELIELERDLMHATFGDWPELFDACNRVNDYLLESTHRRILTTQASRNINLVTGSRRRLQHHWVDLDDVSDMLNERDPRYVEYRRTRHEYVKMIRLLMDCEERIRFGGRTALANITNNLSRNRIVGAGGNGRPAAAGQENARPGPTLQA